MQSKVDRLLQAYYSSILEQPVPGELGSLVAHLLPIESRKHHSTKRANEVLQLAEAPIGRNFNRTEQPS
jgi:hypothetical protein